MHKTVQYTLPITMVGAGLPQIEELAGDAKSYAERLFKFPRIGNLPQYGQRPVFNRRRLSWSTTKVPVRAEAPTDWSQP